MTQAQLLAAVAAAIVILGGLFCAVVIAPRIRAARRSVWERFARRHDLALFDDQDDEQIISGVTHARRLTIRRTDHGSDGDLVGLANVRLELSPRNPPPKGLTVVNAGDSVGKVAHLIDDHVADPAALHESDPEFHMLVRQDGTASDAAARFLTEERRRALQNLANEAGTATVGIEDGALFWEDRVLAGDVEQLERWLSLLNQTAERFDAVARGAARESFAAN